MANIVSEKQINAFVKGLVTEASPLTFPANASLDELNFDLETDGSRTRRLGIDYEVEFEKTVTNFSAEILRDTKVSAHVWEFPGGSTDIVLGIVRIYNRLYFLNLLSANPSANLKNQGVTNRYITLSGLENANIQTTVLNNYCIVTSSDLDAPILLSYNYTTDVVTQEEISIQIRDLYGIKDETTSFSERPSTLSEEHNYNLKNQGWSDNIQTTCWSTYGVPAYSAIACTANTLGIYPSNADTWSLGKVGDINSASFEKFDPSKLIKNSIDNAQAAKGHYIIDAFSRGTSRSTQTILTLPLDSEGGRISACTTYAGRIFYSGVVSNVTSGDSLSPNYSGYIFFSQIGASKEKLGLCYQENDPTSPDISDVLPTDGGTIHIPEASKIVALVVSRGSLIVFAENGIWEIFGDTDGFKATSFQVSKISSTGVTNPDSIIDAGGNILYWAKTGIHVITQEQSSGRLATNNISLSTIQSFYDDIPVLAKDNCRGLYDEQHNHVRWIYNDSATYTDNNYLNRYTKELNFDLQLQAFYVYEISSLVTGSPYICDYFPIQNRALTSTSSDIIITSGDDVIITSLDDVIITRQTTASRTGSYHFLTMVESAFTLSTYKDTTFTDWVSEDSVGVDFSSYLITGYELSGDMLREKQVPHIYFYLEKTEDGYELSGDDLILQNQSSCMVQAQWGWANSAASGKWGTAFQAYRHLRNYIPSGVNDTFDNGESVVVTKNKMRGKGNALSLKIYSETGKDMRLLGWAYEITGKSKG